MAEVLEDIELGAPDVALEAEGVGHRHPAVLGAPEDEGGHVETLERRRIERLLGAGALQGSLAIAGEPLEIRVAPDALGGGHRGIGVDLGK